MWYDIVITHCLNYTHCLLSYRRSEYVDGTNLLSRSWPRGSAVGERGWSAMNVTNVLDAQTRLNEFRCKMVNRGIPAEPMVSGAAYPNFAFCENEYLAPYNPPWEQ